MHHVLAALRCAHCGAEIVREDLNLERGVAVCSLCRTVLVLKKPVRGCREIATPRWFSRVHGGVVWHASPWLPLTAVFFLIAWSAAPWAPEVKFVQVLGALAVIIGTVVVLVHGGHVAFDGRRLTVEHFGVPSSSTFSLDARKILQIFWTDETTVDSSGRREPSFSVMALMDDGTERVLADDLEERDEAMFIVQELERARDLPRAEFPGPR